MQKGQIVNFYCDAYQSFALQFFERDDIPPCEIDKDVDSMLCEAMVIKNLLAGVEEVNIGCRYPQNATLMLDKYGLKGCAIIDGREASKLKTFDRVILYISSLSDFEEGELADLSMLCGQKKLRVMISFGRDLYEMGTLDRRYGQSPVRLLESMGFLDRDCMLLGCNYLEKDDLSVIASYGALTVLTPQEDLLFSRSLVSLAPFVSQDVESRLASGSYPIVDMRAEARLIRGQSGSLCGKEVPSYDEALRLIGLQSDDARRDLLFGNYRVKNEELDARLKILEEQLKEKLWKL